MEFSDSEEEIIDLNDEKSKEEKKPEKSKSKSSSNKIKWVKSSLESLSQMAKNDVEETEYEEHSNINKDEENIDIDIDNEGENQEKISDYDNYNDNDKKDDNYKNNNYNDATEKTEETHADSNMAKNKQSFYTFIWDEGGENVKLIGSF